MDTFGNDDNEKSGKTWRESIVVPKGEPSYGENGSSLLYDIFKSLGVRQNILDNPWTMWYLDQAVYEIMENNGMTKDSYEQFSEDEIDRVIQLIKTNEIMEPDRLDDIAQGEGKYKFTKLTITPQGDVLIQNAEKNERVNHTMTRINGHNNKNTFVEKIVHEGKVDKKNELFVKSREREAFVDGILIQEEDYSVQENGQERYTRRVRDPEYPAIARVEICRTEYVNIEEDFPCEPQVTATCYEPIDFRLIDRLGAGERVGSYATRDEAIKFCEENKDEYELFFKDGTRHYWIGANEEAKSQKAINSLGESKGIIPKVGGIEQV